VGEALEAAREAIARLKVHDACAAAMDLARAANQYVEERAPWAQAKDPDQAEALDETLTSLVRALTVLSALFQPVAPEKMSELASRIGLDDVPNLEDSVRLDLGGRSVRKGDPLFPRVEPSWAAEEG
jgi:methionyl-tRNA synthetase